VLIAAVIALYRSVASVDTRPSAYVFAAFAFDVASRAASATALL
jgi:hypothetical protein